MRPVRLSLAAVLAASLVLAGCSKDEEPAKESSSAKQVKGDPDTWPLTGEKVGNGSSTQKRPVLVAKIDNTGSASPQVGLSKADLVVEELVEGSSTRLAVMYYSQVPAKVGPVRSMRASDIGIVRPVDGQLVTSGAAQVTLDRLDKAGVKYYQEGAKGFSRDSGRTAPYNVFADLTQIESEAKSKKDARPEDYLPWGTDADFTGTQAAKTIGADFGGHVTNWSFAGGTYKNTNSLAAKGDEFTPENVLVLRVKVGDAGYTDPAGNPVPETTLEGKGEAMLFRDGKVAKGTWSKSDLSSELTLKSKDGKEMKVPAGKTWIELVPADNGSVTIK